jgi:hypothetical protein
VQLTDTSIRLFLVEQPPSHFHQRRGAADRGEYRQAAGAFAQIKKAPTLTPGPSDYQQKISLKTFVPGFGSLITAH